MKGWFVDTTTEHYVWFILPENSSHLIISDHDYKLSKNDLKSLKKDEEVSALVKTKQEIQKFTIRHQIQNHEFTKEYNCQEKFVLCEFRSNQTDFDKERVLIQLQKKDSVEIFHFTLESQLSGVLFFSDFDQTNTSSFNLLEKQIVILEASLVSPKMIPFIKQHFQENLESCIRLNSSRDFFIRISKNILKSVFESNLHEHLTVYNLELFFIYINCLRDQIIEFLVSDHAFKTSFEIFRKKLREFVLVNCKKCISRVDDFEASITNSDSLSNDLLYIIVRIHKYSELYDFEKVCEIIDETKYSNFLINSKDIESIVSYYFQIQKKISSKNKRDLEAFKKFTTGLNEHKSIASNL